MSDAQDLIIIAVVLFSLGIGFFIINYASTVMITNIVSAPAINSSQVTVDAFNGVTTSVNRLDYLFFGVFIGLILGFIIAGWFVGGEPVFVFIYFIVGAISIIASMILANTWETITSQAVFVADATASRFPITNNILMYLPIYIAGMCVLGIIVMFSRRGSEGL